MALDRNALRLALFAALEERLAGKIQHATLEVESLTQIVDAKLPALTLGKEGETPESSERGRPPVWTLQFEAAVVARVPPRDPDPDRLVDEIVGWLEAALERQDGEDANSWWTTLGGICSRAYPAGPVEYSGGGQSGRIIVHFPVQIVAPTPRRGPP